jgi:hypothetical protein
MTNRKLELEDVIGAGAVGPFKAGRRLSEIANEIGPPDYWFFSPGEPVSFYVVYGPIEIYVRLEHGADRIHSIIIKVFKFKRRASIFKNKFNGNKMSLYIGPIWRSYPSALAQASALGCLKSTKIGKYVKSDTSRQLTLSGSVELYFYQKDGADVLDAVELS